MQKKKTSNSLKRKKLPFTSNPVPLYFLLFFLIVGYILFFAFIGSIKKNEDADNTIIYSNVNRSLVVTSLVFSIFSLILSIYCLSNYFIVFKTIRSSKSYLLIVLVILSFILFVVSISYCAKKYNVCPSDQEYSDVDNKCIPICAKGSIYNKDTNKCDSQQCLKSTDCPDGYFCCNDNKTCVPVSEKCGNDNCCTSPSQCINGQCCPKERIKPDGECCPSNTIYDTTKKMCRTQSPTQSPIDITKIVQFGRNNSSDNLISFVNGTTEQFPSDAYIGMIGTTEMTSDDFVNIYFTDVMSTSAKYITDGLTSTYDDFHYFVIVNYIAMNVNEFNKNVNTKYMQAGNNCGNSFKDNCDALGTIIFSTPFEENSEILIFATLKGYFKDEYNMASVMIGNVTNELFDFAKYYAYGNKVGDVHESYTIRTASSEEFAWLAINKTAIDQLNKKDIIQCGKYSGGYDGCVSFDVAFPQKAEIVILTTLSNLSYNHIIMINIYDMSMSKFCYRKKYYDGDQVIKLENDPFYWMAIDKTRIQELVDSM